MVRERSFTQRRQHNSDDEHVDDKEVLLPCVQLGKIAGQTCMCMKETLIWLNWKNRNVIDSASVDKRVKVWDVATGQCKLTMELHKKRVQAVAWNHYAPQVLLSGSCDRTAVLKDGRDPSHSGLKWSTKAKVENVAWNGSKHGHVYKFLTSQGFKSSRVLM